MGRVVAVALALLILTAGGYYLWETSHNQLLPATKPSLDLSLHLDERHHVVDVAHLYRRLLTDPQAAGSIEVAVIDQDRRQRGLEALQQADLLLRTQGQDYLHAADQSLAGVAVTDDAPSLHARGRRLASELRRLALAKVSLQEQIDWRDLADLSGPRLEARLDSLLAIEQRRNALEPDLGEVRQLLVGVDARTRVLRGLVTLESILAEPSWQPGWERRLQTAVDQLGGARQRRVRQLREDAFLLYRLKRAEHATDLGSLAFAANQRLWLDLTPAVADILPDVLVRNDAALADAPPPLLRASAAVYTTLGRAADPGATAEVLRAAIEELSGNLAVAFDPAIYGDHLARLRFRLLERLVKDGVPRDGLPDACFAGGPGVEYLAFLDFAATGPSPAAWQAAAATFTEPFLSRWARHRAATAPEASSPARTGDR